MRPMLLVVATLVALVVPSRTWALNTWGSDMSDLWWNPDESGWGVNIAHHYEKK
jgi:hypothetical protein